MLPEYLPERSTRLGCDGDHTYHKGMVCKHCGGTLVCNFLHGYIECRNCEEKYYFGNGRFYHPNYSNFIIEVR